jgi:hypothetical protein
MTDNPPSSPGRDALRAAGFELSELDPAQLEVLDQLTEDELAVLVEVRRRLAGTQPEVSAHEVSPLTVGGLFF